MRKTVLTEPGALLLAVAVAASGADWPDRLYPVARDGKGVCIDRKGKDVWAPGG